MNTTAREIYNKKSLKRENLGIAAKIVSKVVSD